MSSYHGLRWKIEIEERAMQAKKRSRNGWKQSKNINSRGLVFNFEPPLNLGLVKQVWYADNTVVTGLLTDLWACCDM